MKKLWIISVFALLASCNSVPEGSVKTSFKVWGNCGMCKKTIEASLKRDGISSAEWNKDTKMMEVVYDEKKITLDSIHGCIASVGYDTENKKGSDEAYANLHECCQYERRN